MVRFRVVWNLLSGIHMHGRSARQSSGPKMQDLGLRVDGWVSAVRIPSFQRIVCWSSGFRVKGLGFRV